MKWRAVLAAAVVGGAVLLVGYLVGRPEGAFDDTDDVPPPPATVAEGATLGCAEALLDACEELAEQVGADSVIEYRAGSTVDGDVVVIAPAANLGEGLQAGPVVARSPVVVAVWSDRIPALGCGEAVDLACLAQAYERDWVELGGNESWGQVKLGIADPGLTEAGLAAWRAVAGDGVPERMTRKPRLVAPTDAALMVEVLQTGSARADAVVTTEVAVSGQLANAPGRGGRLVVSYPDPAPWVEYVTAAPEQGRAAQVAEVLLEPERQAGLARIGLRPVIGPIDPDTLPEGLGTPGAPMGPLDGAGRAGLLDAWNSLQ